MHVHVSKPGEQRYHDLRLRPVFMGDSYGPPVFPGVFVHNLEQFYASVEKLRGYPGQNKGNNGVRA
jgi:hypothetical protein